MTDNCMSNSNPKDHDELLTEDEAFEMALANAGVAEPDIRYTVATGFGRNQVAFRDVKATDLTATARGAIHLFPGTRTVLDIGGQTMKVSRIDENARVQSFRLNDKCAAGTGAVGKSDGAWACEAWPMIRARTVRPCASVSVPRA